MTLALLIAVVAASTAGVVVPHGAAAATTVTACSQEAPDPQGDSDILYTDDPMPFYDESLDITDTTVSFTATDLVVAITVAKLAARPLVGTGDRFSISVIGPPGTGFDAGYLRDVTGGRPVSYSNLLTSPVATPEFPMRVAPFYDFVNNQVTLTIPRSDAAAALGLTSQDNLIFSQISVDSDAWFAGQRVTYADQAGPGLGHRLAAPECDAYLASQPKPADLRPCGLSFEAPTGDEATEGTPPVIITDDDTDITNVDVRADTTTVTVTEQVARLMATPMTGTGHRFGVAVSQGGRTAHIGAGLDGAVVSTYRTSADGTTGTSSLTAAFDTDKSRVTLRIPRADWDSLFGGPGAAGTVDHLAGESAVAAGTAAPRASDTGAVAPGDGRFSVADCDASLGGPAPTPAPTTAAPPIDVPITAPTLAPTTAPPPPTPAPAPSDSPTAAPSPTGSPAPPAASPSPSASPTQAPQTNSASSAARVVSVRPGAGALSVAFVPATGSGITGYVASCTLQGSKTTSTVTGARSPLTLKGLQARRTYLCSVRPKTSRGLGQVSNTQTGRPGAVPKLTLVAPKRAGAGQLITIAGTASASEIAVANRGVVITFRKAGSSKRTMVGLTKTDGKGRYSLQLTNPGAGAYQATVLIESLVTRNREVYVHAA